MSKKRLFFLLAKTAGPPKLQQKQRYFNMLYNIQVISRLMAY